MARLSHTLIAICRGMHAAVKHCCKHAHPGVRRPNVLAPLSVSITKGTSCAISAVLQLQSATRWRKPSGGIAAADMWWLRCDGAAAALADIAFADMASARLRNPLALWQRLVSTRLLHVEAPRASGLVCNFSCSIAGAQHRIACRQRNAVQVLML